MADMRDRRETQARALEGLAGDAEDLERECASFLSGRYLESLCAVDQPVPDWAWLSALAYLPLHELRAALADRQRWYRRPELLPWLHAMRAMTEALGDAALEARVDPAELQQAIIVPLELLPNAVHFGPAALARAVSVAIERELRRIAANPNRAPA